jgi:hypothetical protein
MPRVILIIVIIRIAITGNISVESAPYASGQNGALPLIGSEYILVLKKTNSAPQASYVSGWLND